MKALTLKQANFANEYLETGNATEAAVRAYKPKNRATARAIGSENLTKPNIQRKITDALAENGLDAELVIKSLVEDIKGKPTDRVSELLLAAKLLGLLDKAKQEQDDEKSQIPVYNITIHKPPIIESL
jgi:phage terminase small subunit